MANPVRVFHKENKRTASTSLLLVHLHDSNEAPDFLLPVRSQVAYYPTLIGVLMLRSRLCWYY